MKKIGIRLLQVSMVVITFFATSTAVSASSLLGYQPELPKELRK